MAMRSGAAALAVVLLAGCTAEPRRAEILINTIPPGAVCTLSREGQPVAATAPTPAIAIVDPIPGDLNVLCRRPAFADAAITIPVAPAPRDALSYGSGRPLATHPERVDIPLVPLPH